MSIISDMTDDLRKNLAPLDEVANTSLELALKRRKRSEDLADDKSRREFSEKLIDKQAGLNEKAAEKADERRQKDNQEMARVKAISEANAEGADVPLDATYEQAIKARKAKNQEVVLATLESTDQQRTYYLKQRDLAYSSLRAMSKSDGDSEQKRKALQFTVDDPAVAPILTPESRAFIKSALSATTDPDKAVQLVTEHLKTNYGWMGKFPFTTKPGSSDEAGKNASAFSTAYQSYLGGIVEPAKAEDIKTLREAYHRAGQQADEFMLKSRDVLSAASRWAPKDELDKYKKSWGVTLPKFGVGADGILAPPGAAVKEPSVEVTPTSVPAPVETVPPTAMAPAPIGEQNSIASDVTNRMVPVVQSTAGSLNSAAEGLRSSVGSLVAPLIPGSQGQRDIYNSIFGSPTAPAPTAAEVEAARAARDLRLKAPPAPPTDTRKYWSSPPQSSIGSPEELKDALLKDAHASLIQNPNQPLMDATPEEVQAANQLNSLFIPPGQSSQLEAMIQSRNPQQRAHGIAAFNALVKAVRGFVSQPDGGQGFFYPVTSALPTKEELQNSGPVKSTLNFFDPALSAFR